MTKTNSLTLVLAAGTMIAPAALADTPAIGVATSDAPRRLTGHLYYNATTGASVFTPAKEYLANRAQSPLRALGDDINGDGHGDLWVNTNTDPCPIGTPTNPDIRTGGLDAPTTQGDHHLYRSQFLPGDTDVLVETVSFTFWTDLLDTDTNADTVPDGNTNGVGIEITFWDREGPFGSGACCCLGPDAMASRLRTVTLPMTGLPGTLTPGELAGVVVTLELGPDQIFELADSDGVGPANGNFNPFVAALDTDTDSDTIPDVSSADFDQNGTIDWSHSFRGIQPTDGRNATIAYTLAAPGRFGAVGRFALDGVTPLNAQAGVMGDGLIDIIERTAPPAPFQFDNARIKLNSIESPMADGFPFTSTALGTAPDQLTVISRFSIFFASLGEHPDPTVPPTNPWMCPGFPNSDFFGWGGLASDGVTFVGGLNCTIDDNSDTIPEGRPWSGAFLALSSLSACNAFADCDGNGSLNIGDIDCFVAAFLGGDLGAADCDANSSLNIDDIDCFVASFLSGCP